MMISVKLPFRGIDRKEPRFDSDFVLDLAINGELLDLVRKVSQYRCLLSVPIPPVDPY